jgi:imidazolonepropionase-like amidohydrolase
MRVRVVLRSLDGDTVTRDVRDGCWDEPDGTPDLVMGADTWALPGLVDAHSHLARATLDYLPGDLDAAAERARSSLKAGVGLLLDKGWSDLTVVDLVDKLDLEERPEIEAAGVIYSVDGGYVEGFARNVGPGGLEAAVEQGAREGRGWVKLIGDWPRKGIGPVPNFTEEELNSAVRVASTNGARVAIHTLAREVPSMAVRAGVDSIEHGPFLTADDLSALGARGGMWVPTAILLDALIHQLGPESTGGRLMREGLANLARLLPLAEETGTHVLTGTDLVVGSDQVALEAIRLAELGLSARAAIAAVSLSGYRATGRSSAFAVGTPANAVLFAEDPLRDLRVLSHPRAIIRLGRVVG